MQSHVLVLSIEEIIGNFNTHSLFKEPILQLFMLVLKSCKKKVWYAFFSFSSNPHGKGGG